MLNRKETEELYRLLSEKITPKAELEYDSVFHLLVAVVLSAQATDKSVNLATRAFFPERRTPQDFLDWGVENLERATKSIGLYRNKSKAIIALCHKLISDFNGEVPPDLESLLTLPGVGVKTAKVVLNVGFGKPVVAVDTHIFRVANRTGLATADTPERVGELLEKKTPKQYLKDAHHYLLLHGRYTCTARNPHCDSCVIAPYCKYRARTANQAKDTPKTFD